MHAKNQVYLVFRVHVWLRYTFQVRNLELVAVYFSGQKSRVGCGMIFQMSARVRVCALFVCVCVCGAVYQFLVVPAILPIMLPALVAEMGPHTHTRTKHTHTRALI